MDSLTGFFAWLYECRKSLSRRLKERMLRKRFRHYTSFSAYWYAYHCDEACIGDPEAKEIVLKLSLAFLDSCVESRFENCMFVAEKSFVKDTVKAALLKAEFYTRDTKDFKRIRDRVMYFFDLDSEEVRRFPMTTGEYDDLLVKKHIYKKKE